VRILLFENIIYKPVSWFDRKDKAPGILSMILSEDVKHLNGLTTEIIGSVLEALLTLGIGLVFSSIFQWKMTIVCLLMTPFSVLGGVI